MMYLFYLKNDECTGKKSLAIRKDGVLFNIILGPRAVIDWLLAISIGNIMIYRSNDNLLKNA